MTKNNKAMDILKRMWVEPGVVATSAPGSALLTKASPSATAPLPFPMIHKEVTASTQRSSWSHDDALCAMQVLYKHIQGMLSAESAVIAETGDSWFNCQKLKLPDGCGCGTSLLANQQLKP